MRTAKEVAGKSQEIIDKLVASGLVDINIANEISILHSRATSINSFVSDAQASIKRNQVKASLTQVLELLEPLYVFDSEQEPLKDSKGRVVFDNRQAFFEKSQLGTNWDEYLVEKVLPFRAGATLSGTPADSGFEVLWARIFAKPIARESLEEINLQIKFLGEKLQSETGRGI
jgi:hypothetical protein